MVKKFIQLSVVAVLSIVTAIVVQAEPASASSLKVQPLMYKETLKKAEKKKGFIDISNPTGQSLTVTTSVQAFKQVNDKGDLEFYDDEQISEGIKTDLEGFELKPREALRMYFLVDGEKLPEGDVFAAIFFSTKQGEQSGVGQQVRIGTLLSLVNGTPSARQAELSQVDVPWLQIGNQVQGTYSVKNTAPENTSSGFYPEVQAVTSPWGESKTLQSSLVFAGNERANQLEIGAKWGIVKLDLSYQDNHKTAWVLLLPIWWPAILVLLVMVVGGAIWWRKRNRKPASGLRMRR